VNVVDSSAWMAFFANERHARSFAQPIGDLDQLLVPGITLTEVFKSIFRQRDERSALLAIAHMKRGRVVDLDESIALDAASYGLQFKLPLADSVIYATARRFNAMVWTQDVDFEGLENVRYFA
jgi:predicted nucleic acid-binding protein